MTAISATYMGVSLHRPPRKNSRTDLSKGRMWRLFQTTEGYSGMAAVDWMREALLTLDTVPDLPSDADGMQGSMVPVMRSKVWQGIMQNAGGPLFVATGNARAQVALNPNNLHYAYAADYERHESNVAELIDLPEFKGSVLKSLKALCRSASRERLEFYPSPDPRQLYKLMIKIVLIRQLSESPYMAAQYREMLRYGAQQAAFRTGVVSDARSALLTLIDATAKNHNVKVDAQNKSDRDAAKLMIDQENKSRDAAAAAEAARKRDEARRKQSEIDMQIATNTSVKLAADMRAVIQKLATAKLERTDADRSYAEAQTYSQAVVKSQDQAIWERNATESARKRYMASRDLAAELSKQVATVRQKMEQNVAELEAQRALAESASESNRTQLTSVMNQASTASANLEKLKIAQEELRSAYNELVTRKSDADFQADADRRELGRILAQIKELSGDYDDPNGALIKMQSSLTQIADNITRYDDKTKANMLRDAKNKVCLAKSAAPVPAASSTGVGAAATGTAEVATPKWNEEDGQRYTFTHNKFQKFSDKLHEHDSAKMCFDACKADTNCWIMAHYKPEKKGVDEKQGECWFGDETASKNFTKKGDGRSFSAHKR
jgi:hypothetical protein